MAKQYIQLRVPTIKHYSLKIVPILNRTLRFWDAVKLVFVSVTASFAAVVMPLKCFGTCKQLPRSAPCLIRD